jgi:hypothetical protein
MTEEDLQEEYSKGKRFQFVWLASKDKIADMFTEILSGNVHDSLLEGIGMKD